MSRRVMSLFHGSLAGGILLIAACLLTLAALLGAPASAAAATGEVVTVYWKKGTASGYELQATVTTTSLAETVTLSGPNISSTDLYPTADGQGMVFRGTATFVPSTAAPIPVKDTAYTLSVNYGSGGPTAETVTARISNVLGSSNVPALTAPLPAVASTASPTFYWTAPATAPATFSGYSVRVSGPELLQWGTDLPSTQTSVPYDGPLLEAAVSYDWGVAAMDSNGNKAESRGTFVLGANFTGKVTDINGNALAGIEVQAANAAGEDMGIVTTGPDGTYLYAGLAPGDYKVHFNFRAYYWRNKLDSTTADVLTVTAGSVTSNVNAVIGGWGAISGSVYLFSGNRPTTADVSLLDLNKVAVTSVPAVKVALSSGFGNFYLAPVRPGTYYLRFAATGYQPVDKQVVVTLNQTLQGVPEVAASLAPVTASLTVQTSGAGTVTGSGISCTAASPSGCSSSYTPGTVVTLSATSTAGSVFGGWSGACTGTGSCQITVDSAKSVTAIFTAKPATVRIDGSTPAYFNSVASALDSLLAVSAPQTMRANSTEIFVENVLMQTPAQVTFIGGYTDTDATFRTQSATSRTVIDGSLTIRKGKFIPQRLGIR